MCYQVLPQTKTFETFNAFGLPKVFRWFKTFSERRDLIEDEPGSSEPSSSRTDANVGRIRDFVLSDRWLKVGMIEKMLDLTYTTFLTNEKYVQKWFQKTYNRRERCLDFLESIENDPQPPFYPDLSRCDLFFFPRFHLKKCHFYYWKTFKRL